MEGVLEIEHLFTKAFTLNLHKIILDEIQRLNCDVPEETGDGIYARATVFNEELSALVTLQMQEHLDISKLLGTHIFTSAKWFYTIYNAGGNIEPHKDGTFTFQGKESVATILIYLNDDFQGGETIILDSLKKKAKSIHSVRPVAGKALILLPNVPHKSASVKSGQKLIIRSDVFSTI